MYRHCEICMSDLCCIEEMPTNIDGNPELATRGQNVRIKEFGGAEPDSWKGVGIVQGIELDVEISKLNNKGIQKYRILVDFGDGKIASLLPCILKVA